MNFRRQWVVLPKAARILKEGLAKRGLLLKNKRLPQKSGGQLRLTPALRYEP